MPASVCLGMLLDCYCFYGTTIKPTSTHNEPTELSAVEDIFSSVGYVLLTSFTDYCDLKVAFKARCSRVNELFPSLPYVRLGF